MYVCTHVCKHVCSHACMHACMCDFIDKQTSKPPYMNACMHAYLLNMNLCMQMSGLCALYTPKVLMYYV